MPDPAPPLRPRCHCQCGPCPPTTWRWTMGHGAQFFLCDQCHEHWIKDPHFTPKITEKL